MKRNTNFVDCEMNNDSMSETPEIISILEKRVSKLLQKLTHLEQQTVDLKKVLLDSEAILKLKHSEIEALNLKYNALKTANSLLGSEENKKDTKLKINTLIREIDYCIAQLSD